MKIDLTGMIYGRLLVIKEVGRKNKGILWECICECGNIKNISSNMLRIGDAKSCGCYNIQKLKERRKYEYGEKEKHKSEYWAWQDMKQRCYNIKNKRYKDWGGRGIKVCARWLHSFENFISDIGLRPSNTHSLDRYPNVNGNYEPSNVRWATNQEQSRNKTTNIWLEYNGVRKIQKDWAKELMISEKTIKTYLNKGLSFDFVYQRFKNNVHSSLSAFQKAKQKI